MKCAICGKSIKEGKMCFKCADLTGSDIIFMQRRFFPFSDIHFICVPRETAIEIISHLFKDYGIEEIAEKIEAYVEQKIMTISKKAFKNLQRMLGITDEGRIDL